MVTLDQLVLDEIAKIEIKISKPNPERGDKWNEDEYAVFKVTIRNLSSFDLKDVIVSIQSHNCTHAPIWFIYPRVFVAGSMSRNAKKAFFTRYKANNNVKIAKLWATVSAEIIPEKTKYSMGLKQFTIYEE